MKIIHLADLHIGKRVNEFSMIDDQKYILNQILEIIDNKNIFPAYHMNKKHWISIVIDKNIKLEAIKELIDISYSLVK